MFVPPGYDDTTDESDLDDVDYYAQFDNKPKVLTEAEKHEILLRDLMDYVQVGDVEKSIQIIKEHNLPVDVTLHQEWTPLLLAASYGHYRLTKELIELGANVDQVKDCMTVLMHACNISKKHPNYKSAVKIVKLLVENRCDVNYCNRKRVTAYLFAAMTGNLDVLKYLGAYCDTEVVDNQGWNSLFHAVNHNNYLLVRYLLRSGMDYRKCDVRRNTPLFYAQREGHKRIIALFPDEKAKESQWEAYLCGSYDYSTEVANPRFMRDVNVMLHGMNCMSMTSKFTNEPSMNLSRFLTLSKDDLIAMEITKPYQQHRILGGLYEFHARPFKFKSIPHIHKQSVLSTYNISFTLFSALRHYITMQSTLRYLRLNVTEWDDSVLKEIESIETEVRSAKGLMTLLQDRCRRWERENKRVDFISSNDKRKSTKIGFFVSVVSAVALTLYFKFRM